MKKNIFIVLFGLVLIFISCILMFKNSKKELIIDINVKELKEEINNLVVEDKIETLKKYETKISELNLKLNELEGTNYEMYNNKEISLYDYMINKNKINDYKKEVTLTEQLLEQKIKSVG